LGERVGKSKGPCNEKEEEHCCQIAGGDRISTKDLGEGSDLNALLKKKGSVFKKVKNALSTAAQLLQEGKQAHRLALRWEQRMRKLSQH